MDLTCLSIKIHLENFLFSLVYTKIKLFGFDDSISLFVV